MTLNVNDIQQKDIQHNNVQQYKLNGDTSYMSVSK